MPKLNESDAILAIVEDDSAACKSRRGQIFVGEAGAGREAVLTVPVAAADGASIRGPFSLLPRKKPAA